MSMTIAGRVEPRRVDVLLAALPGPGEGGDRGDVVDRRAVVGPDGEIAARAARYLRLELRPGG
ncbi:MAG: hypothetical protein H0X44_09375 [Acidobacteria bacterium]|nr:hypothetical protein [Acidobacteriota bacterium]